MCTRAFVRACVCVRRRYGFMPNQRVQAGLPLPAHVPGVEWSQEGGATGINFRRNMFRHLGLPDAPDEVAEAAAAEDGGGDADAAAVFVSRDGRALLRPDPRTGLAPLLLTEHAAAVPETATGAGGSGGGGGGGTEAAGVDAEQEANILCMLRLRRGGLRSLQACAQHSPDVRQCCASPDGATRPPTLTCASLVPLLTSSPPISRVSFED
eukprot:COSAG05_NODE_800_length_7226_cov_4.300126_2_plen_210_part_00